MNGELISVIIPVYGVEPYLEKCVESVLAQTYEPLEVILVDDGSPDGCPALCDAFAARDGRVRVIHKENGGQGSARNRGLDIARGAYIGFVDSDDYIVPDMYEKLYTALKAADADLCICDYVMVDTDGAVTRRHPALPSAVISAREAFEHMEFDQTWWQFTTPVNRLYSRRVLEQAPFPEDRRYEDLFQAHRLYDRCGRIALIPDVLYYYVQREGSSMHLPITVSNLDEVEGFMDRYAFYRQRGLDRLAAGSLRKAYVKLWPVVGALAGGEDRRAVRVWVSRVAREQIRRLDPRGGLLWLKYVRTRLSGARTGGDAA